MPLEVAGAIGQGGNCRDHRVSSLAAWLRSRSTLRISIGSVQPKAPPLGGPLGAKALQDFADLIAGLDRVARPVGARLRFRRLLPLRREMVPHWTSPARSSTSSGVIGAGRDDPAVRHLLSSMSTPRARSIARVI